MSDLIGMLPRFFFYMILIKELQPVPVLTIARKTDTTYTHVYKQINEMEKEGLIKTKKIGRIRAVTLTVKGDQQSYHMKKIVEGLNNESKKETDR